MTEAEKRYFAETSRVLRREGFQVEQLENGHLNVMLNGQPLCEVNKISGIMYRDVSTPERFEVKDKAPAFFLFQRKGDDLKMIEAVLSNKDHPEYGRMTLSFPIPRVEYDRCIELVERMEIGSASDQDCQVYEVLGTWPVLKRLENTQVNFDELDYLAKRLDSFDAGEAAQFQAMAEKLDLHKPTVKLSTYCSYELYIRAHIKPQLGGKYMNTLRAEDLQDFFIERSLNGNQRGGGLSPKTLTNMRNMMHLSFSQAVKNKVLGENLIESVRLPRAMKKEMRVLDREEQMRLINAVKMSPEPSSFGIIFDMFTGLRIGELCGLRWENVDMTQRTIKICETRNRLPNFDDSIGTSTSVHTVKTTKPDKHNRTGHYF